MKRLHDLILLSVMQNKAASNTGALSLCWCFEVSSWRAFCTDSTHKSHALSICREHRLSLFYSGHQISRILVKASRRKSTQQETSWCLMHFAGWRNTCLFDPSSYNLPSVRRIVPGQINYWTSTVRYLLGNSPMPLCKQSIAFCLIAQINLTSPTALNESGMAASSIVLLAWSLISCHWYSNWCLSPLLWWMIANVHRSCL